jgi:autotransporter translocation and assembly factor TamB
VNARAKKLLRLLLILMPPLLLVLAIVHVIHSEATPAWISERLQRHMAGVKMENVRGTLPDGIHIDRLRIESGRALVVLDDISVKLQWRCLMWGSACIEKLHAQNLLISVKPSDDPPSKTTTLPTLKTPLALRWQQLSIDRLVFGEGDNAPHLDAIRCSGSWSGSQLFVDWGQLQYLGNDLEVAGSIIFSGGYPLDVRTRLQNAKAGINMSANVGGDVLQLNAQLLLEQPARAQGNATFSPLDPLLPYRARLSLLTPYVWRPADSTEITIADNAVIELQGDRNTATGELRAQAKTPYLDQTTTLAAPFQFDIAKSILSISPQLQAGKTQLDGKATLTLSQTIVLAATATARHINPGLWLSGYNGDIDAGATLSLSWNEGRISQASGELNALGSVQQDNAEAQAVSAQLAGNWNRQQGWKLTRGDAGFGNSTLHMGAQGQGSRAKVQLAAAAPQTGKLDLQCDVDGLAQPTLRASCTRFLWYAPADWKIPNWHNQNTLQLQWASEKKLLTLAPFCLRAASASVCSEKESSLHAGNATAAVKLNAIDLAWARYWLPANHVLQGALSGNVNVRTSPDKVAQWSIKLATRDAQAIVPAGARKARITLEQFSASIDSNDSRMRAVIDATAEGFGKLDAQLTMTPDQELQGRVTLRQTALTALQPMLPQANIVAGTLQADVGISGSRSVPLLHGSVLLQQGEIRTSQVPWPIKNIDAQLGFEDRYAKLNASAKIDDQTVNANGEFDWQEKLQGKMQLAASELRITPLPRTDVWISPDLSATLQDGVVDIRGRIDVPRAYIIIKELPKRGVPVSRDVVIVNERKPGKSPFNVTGNIEIALGDAVSFRGFGLQTRLAGKLGLSFKDGQPAGNGRVELVDGRYRAYGQLLDIRSGDLIFVGPLDNPVIRIEAIRSDVPEPNVVGVRANGELRNPDIALFSTPAMSERARLQYLLTGRAPDSESEDSSGSMLGQALLAFGAGESEGVVAGVADKFGVHDVSLSTAEGTTGTQVQLSAYLNSRLFLRYGKSVFDNANEVTMRYQLTKSLFVEAVSGLANALDLLWSLEFGRAEE